ncbi:MarR family transcriptional regulator [Streptomyces sp. NPDC048636]|uniref:MarR family winged helix-turn-helix transcriptional regulator n=1 Tax=Streptomyces sp. NPDC048636 TaxID=3155762 RepID=UPI0034312759
MSIDERRRQAAERLGKASRVQVTLAVLINQTIAAQAGVNQTDLQCLNLLTLQGQLSPSQLAQALAMTRGGAVTAMIDRLEKAGYVRRVRGHKDRRQVLIEIVQGTETNALMEHYLPLRDIFDHVTAQYDPDELDFLAEYIERNNAALGFTTRHTGTGTGTTSDVEETTDTTATGNMDETLATLARLRHARGNTHQAPTQRKTT